MKFVFNPARGEKNEMMPAEGVSHGKTSAVRVISTPQKIRIMI